MAQLVMVPFQIKRTALTAAVQTPILAPFTCQSCTVLNATPDALKLITTSDGSEFLTIAPSFERVIWLPQPISGQFRSAQIVFWLEAAQSGTAILIWA